ncbi:MAG TPA: hypothetical protein VGE72_09315, partial [Azospirillum sp.]
MKFDDRLAAHLEAVAAFHGWPDRERAGRWAERLRLNRAEIERFASASPARGEPYLGPERHPLDVPAPSSAVPAMGAAAAVARRVAAGDL